MAIEQLYDVILTIVRSVMALVMVPIYDHAVQMVDDQNVIVIAVAQVQAPMAVYNIIKDVVNQQPVKKQNAVHLPIQPPQYHYHQQQH